MKNRLLSLLFSLGFAFTCSGLPAFASKDAKTDAPERKPKLILNAAEATPEYSYDKWDKKVMPVKAGLLVDAPSGQGGFGANNLKIDVDGVKEIEAIFYTGRENAMQTVSISLIDLFGSEIGWTVRIDQIAPVQAVIFRLKLSEGKLTLKSKRTSFDFTDIKGYQIKGDWNEQPAQFTVVGIRARF